MGWACSSVKSHKRRRQRLHVTCDCANNLVCATSKTSAYSVFHTSYRIKIHLQNTTVQNNNTCNITRLTPENIYYQLIWKHGQWQKKMKHHYNDYNMQRWERRDEYNMSVTRQSYDTIKYLTLSLSILTNSTQWLPMICTSFRQLDNDQIAGTVIEWQVGNVIRSCQRVNWISAKVLSEACKCMWRRLHARQLSNGHWRHQLLQITLYHMQTEPWRISSYNHHIIS